MTISFNNSYAKLPKDFYTKQAPEQVSSPEIILVNDQLASFLSIPSSWLNSDHGLGMLSGNYLPEGSEPIATVYAGHQFGTWNPQLGDGRAILLGEVIAQDGLAYDIQLKGSGRTPYSRMGDGRSPLGPVLREYLVSEAMNALGIKSTRALAAIATGDYVERDTTQPGAILTRVARSHVRIGTFQFFASIRDTKALELLIDYVLKRHYPDSLKEENKALSLLTEVMKAQARLVASWQSIGFVHGVMNTDNMLVSGETIDFGPCAFIDSYKKDAAFSSIDQFGRYAFGNQPNIAHWNIACLAQALIPLIDEDEELAINLAKEYLEKFPIYFKEEEDKLLRSKFGFKKDLPGDKTIMTEFLDMLEENQLDFTLSFRLLSELSGQRPDLSVSSVAGFPSGFDEWLGKWKTRTEKEENPEIQQEMLSTNPAIIPRNHLIEKAINESLEQNFELFHKLTKVLAKPFDLNDQSIKFANKPLPSQVVRKTFCGT